jgi:dihydrofolate synthase / folylpolyglutamate synthase
LPAPLTLPEWLQYQQQVHPKSIELGLERVRQVAQRLGLLPVLVPSAIVGGTNGKGSTATHLASLLQAAGRRTGLFTSPHLRRYNERISIDGLAVSDAELIAAFTLIEGARGTITLTYFEFNALAALQIFRARAVQAMVLEVGLGGRLDASNIVAATVAVLCSIGLDHTDWLGDTIELIGREKAGIFRAATPVVLGQAAMPASVFEVARALNCPLLVAQQDFKWHREHSGHWRYEDAYGSRGSLPAPQLAGEIQYRNAATAIAALGVLLRAEAAPPADVAVLCAGLNAVRLEGRMQRVLMHPHWLLDVAHNPAAAAVLAAALQAESHSGRTIAVFGMLCDKDAAGVAAALNACIDHWCLCDVADARGLRASQLRQLMGQSHGNVEECGTVAAACARALVLAGPADRVVVCGSFHVVGPALDFLEL